jgi:hypothetical protein
MMRYSLLNIKEPPPHFLRSQHKLIKEATPSISEKNNKK